MNIITYPKATTSNNIHSTAMAGASKFYKRTSTKLLDNHIFWRFIADANTPDGLTAATAYLTDDLTYTGAPEYLCNHNTGWNVGPGENAWICDHQTA